MITRTFLNGDKELAERGERCLCSTQEDLLFFEKCGGAEDIDELIDQLRYNGAGFHEARQAIRKFNEVGNIYDYGLSFDYVELGTFNDQKEDYFRYQFSWGGPSAELRIYEDGTIEYIFLDWFTGVGFNVTGEPGFSWLVDWLEDRDALNFERERERYDYLKQLYAREDKNE